MDRSAFRHRLAVVQSDERHFDVFVRSDDGAVEHYWRGDEVMFGPEDLGGHFDTDPSSTGSEGCTSSAARARSWSTGLWPDHQPGLLGQPIVVTLPGLCVADPEVIGSGGELHVFAPSLDGPMRHWLLSSLDGGWSEPEVMTGAIADHNVRPCVVRRPAGGFDVFSVDGDNGGMRHWFNDESGWHTERRNRDPGRAEARRAADALWSAASRLDVFAVRFDGVPVHWGFDGRAWFDDEVRLGSPGVLQGEPDLVSALAKQLTFIARTRDAAGETRVASWSLDPEPARALAWAARHRPGSVARHRWLSLGAGDIGPRGDGRGPMGQMEMLSRSVDGSF